jgi:murein DD-endopeptidase MepM/ murein hydrolase activator NlpD
MTFKFLVQPLLSGLYEPEGIYLHTPVAGRWPVVQRWGDQAAYYAQFRYNGVPLKGHIGLDFATPIGTLILAVDQGRVTELSYEHQGFGRYLKVEHSWGEAFYANLEETIVESGQVVARGDQLGYTGDSQSKEVPHLHFGLRIKPFQRFDGWGGFTDPLPFLSSADLLLPEDEDEGAIPTFPPPPMVNETPGMRRP